MNHTMQFESQSIFEWRGPKHRVVVELPKAKRSTEAMETMNTAWLIKNKKRKTRSTLDQPRWYLWEDELMDSDEYEALQKATKMKEADPENQAAKTGKSKAKTGKGKSSASSPFDEDPDDPD